LGFDKWAKISHEKEFVLTQWTVPQLSIMIIYYCTWSILIQNRLGLYCQLTIWPRKYKRKHTSCLWYTLSQDQRKYAAWGGAWKCLELSITQCPTRPRYLSWKQFVLTQLPSVPPGRSACNPIIMIAFWGLLHVHIPEGFCFIFCL